MQVLLGLYFLLTWVNHFLLPPGLPAAAGLVLIMIGAAVWHFPRAEMLNIGMNVVLAALAAGG